MNMYRCRVGETMIDESVSDIHVKKMMMSASIGRFQRDKHLTRHSSDMDLPTFFFILCFMECILSMDHQSG